MVLIAPSKTPTTAIARVLRDLGLKQGKGQDFRVAGHYVTGERRSTYVIILNREAEEIVADKADLIEQRTADREHFPFTVSIRFGDSGRPVSHITNAAVERVREPRPVAAATGPAGVPGEDAGHCAQCSRLLIWDRTGKRVNDEWGEYLCYGPDRVSTQSAVHLLAEPQPQPTTAAVEEPQRPAAAEMPEPEATRPTQVLQQEDPGAGLPDHITVRVHSAKAREWEVVCTQCGAEDGQEKRVAFRWGMDAEGEAHSAAWNHHHEHQARAAVAAELADELLARQATKLKWSEAQATTMRMAAAGELYRDVDGTFYQMRDFWRGNGRAVAAGRVRALLAAGLLEAADDDGRCPIQPTRDGHRALKAWTRHQPHPMVKTRREEAEPLPYLFSGDEHRRRWEEAQRLLEESRRATERAMLEHAARLERQDADEALDRQWREECGILNPFARRPHGWQPSQLDQLHGALVEVPAESPTAEPGTGPEPAVVEPSAVEPRLPATGELPVEEPAAGEVRAMLGVLDVESTLVPDTVDELFTQTGHSSTAALARWTDHYRLRLGPARPAFPVGQH